MDNGEFVALCLTHWLTIFVLMAPSAFMSYQLLPSGSSPEGHWRQQIIKHDLSIIIYYYYCFTLIWIAHHGYVMIMCLSSEISRVLWLTSPSQVWVPYQFRHIGCVYVHISYILKRLTPDSKCSVYLLRIELSMKVYGLSKSTSCLVLCPITDLLKVWSILCFGWYRESQRGERPASRQGEVTETQLTILVSKKKNLVKGWLCSMEHCLSIDARSSIISAIILHLGKLIFKRSSTKEEKLRSQLDIWFPC